MILARGGSKGVPRKNLRPFLGRPLLSWVLDAAVAAPSVARVILVTDDAEIAALGRCPVEVLAEPPALARDDVGDLPVLRWALAALGIRHGPLVHLRATSPLVRPADIDAAVGCLSSHPALTSLRSVRPAAEHPRKMYREAPEIDGIPTLTPYTGPAHAANSPRQTLERVWSAAGYLDVFRAEVVLGPDGPEGAIIGRLAAPLRAVDIDTAEEWARAEALAHGAA